MDKVIGILCILAGIAFPIHGICTRAIRHGWENFESEALR